MLAQRPGRLVAITLLAVHVSGCAPWRPVLLGPPGLNQPAASRATAGDVAPTPVTALRQEAVDEEAFWDWVWDQKWYIALALAIVAVVVVVAWGDDCAPTDQLCSN